MNENNIENEDVLDWNFYLANPPQKPSVTVQVKLKYAGRRKPLPYVDYWYEDELGECENGICDSSV